MTRVESPAERSWIGQLLDFERRGAGASEATGKNTDLFIAHNVHRGVGDRLFGGLIGAQALAAAGATVEPDKLPQSLHLYFVRGGEYDADVELEVERTRDGRSFDTRRVTARQHGKVILEMIASFHRAEPASDWQDPRNPALDFGAGVAREFDLGFAGRFDIRVAQGSEAEFPEPPFWIRTRDVIEDDPLIRAGMLTFMSDFGPVPAACPPGYTPDEETGFAASLDHAVWFHRPFHPDQWHLYDVRRLNNSDSRGLVAGSLYDRAGALVASTTQEALWRL